MGGRLIDADALIKWINGTGCFMDVFKRVTTDIINKQPTVDAVPVCRCEKCRHWEETECFDGIPFGYCHRKTFADKKDSFHPRDFFCADGEGRTE